VPAADDLLAQISDTLARRTDDLIGLSHDIWHRPELAFAEHYASERCADMLRAAGFGVTAGIAELPTAFVAEIGTGPLVMAVCAEYDALPDIGHACGHNMIAAAGIGAGLALADSVDALGITLRIYGTPAEESGGGKIFMLERGAFDGVHAAMMVHPAPYESDVFPTLASDKCNYRMHGRNAHSSLAPHLGINAGDALTIGQVAVGLLRQHLVPGDQVHGIVTRGGEAPNVVPGLAEATFNSRSPTLEQLAALRPRIDRCFEAGALATGARLEILNDRGAYSEFEHDEDLAAMYKRHAEARGRTFSERPTQGAGSTDMANLSLMLPTIHPMLALDTGGHVNHQPEFADHCITPEADRTMLDGAAAMALTIAEASGNSALSARLLSGDTSYGNRDSYPWNL
jgi:amidohydrolase